MSTPAPVTTGFVRSEAEARKQESGSKSISSVKSAGVKHCSHVVLLKVRCIQLCSFHPGPVACLSKVYLWSSCSQSFFRHGVFPLQVFTILYQNHGYHLLNLDMKIFVVQKSIPDVVILPFFVRIRTYCDPSQWSSVLFIMLTYQSCPKVLSVFPKIHSAWVSLLLYSWIANDRTSPLSLQMLQVERFHERNICSPNGTLLKKNIWHLANNADWANSTMKLPN